MCDSPRNSAGVIEAIRSTRMIAILRGDLKGQTLEIIAVLVEAGIPVVEITMNSPSAIASIASASKHFGDRAVLGAGTVTHPQEVLRAQQAGARFIVSPNTNPEVIETTRNAGLCSFPGAFTCSEVMQAFAAGADAVKLFPMVDASPNLVRALRAPLGDVRLVPTGGITAANAADYLRAGAWALGVGSELVRADAATDSGLTQLRSRAQALTDAIAGFRAEQ